jgi:hypothetical protein
MSNTTTRTVISTIKGKHGTATVYTNSRPVKGSDRVRKSAPIVSVQFASGKKFTTRASLVDLRTMKAESLDEALRKVVFGGIGLETFRPVTLNSQRGMFRGRVNPKNQTGFGTYIAKGKKPLTFDFARVDTAKMKSPNALAAIRKALFAPKGGIALIDRTPVEA